jgi:hypothetical protein
MELDFIIRDQEAGGSNPLAPTNSFQRNNLQMRRAAKNPLPLRHASVSSNRHTTARRQQIVYEGSGPSCSRDTSRRFGTLQKDSLAMDKAGILIEIPGFKSTRPDHSFCNQQSRQMTSKKAHGENPKDNAGDVSDVCHSA